MGWADLTDGAMKTVLATLGTQATYNPVQGSPYPLTGVFESAYRIVDPMTGAPVVSDHPVFGVRLADLAAAPTKGDTLTIGTTTYKVLKSEDDGEGGALLTLNKLA